jgi:hypothetical protein
MPIGGSISNFPQGFTSGLSVRGMPLIQMQPGNVFWLDNSTSFVRNVKSGSDNNRGTYQAPFATLQYAVNSCTAGTGDIIFVSAGHAETISTATALNLNKSGVAIIGLGSGNARPTFTLATANTATITVSAANVTIQNCIFTANFLNIAALFTVTARDFALDNCDQRDTSAILNFLTTVATNTTDNAANGLTITRNTIISTAASGVANLFAGTAACDRVTIADNYIAYLTTNAGAVIPMSAGKALTNLLLLRNTFNLTNAAATATGYLITTDTTGSGFINGNVDFCLANTTYASSLAVTAGRGFRFGTNGHSRTADRSSGAVLPTPDA